MRLTRTRTEFLLDYRYVPESTWPRNAFTLLAAGKVAAAPDYRIERADHPGQDLLYCLSGNGFVRTEGRRLAVGPNQLVWIANEQPHAHWPDRRDPWTVLWLRLEGPGTTACRRKLFGSHLPLVTPESATVITAWFERVFAAFTRRRSRLDFVLNHLIAELLVEIEASAIGADERHLPVAILSVVQGMRSAPEQGWRAEDLMQTSGLSAAQLRRLFRRHLQTTPRQFLRRERLMLAQKLLLETTETVSGIAERCGFCDVYHLSREFRRATGRSPTVWRRLELGTAARSI